MGRTLQRRTKTPSAAYPFLFSTAVAAAFLAICSKNSFLYPMNDWVDVQCFRTVGNAMLHGQVLYRDIYEQKGPLLYLLYAMATLISPRSFFGAYLMETASFSAFLYYSGKCAELYLPDARWAVRCLQLILAAVVATATAFVHGGSAEELCLFMTAGSLYMVLRAAAERQPIPGRDAFWIGLFASAALWIKYTFCGFYGGLAVFVLLYYGLGPGKLRRLPSAVGMFLLGTVPITALVLGYFILNGALADLFQAYFYNNIFLFGRVDSSLYYMLQRCYVLCRNELLRLRVYIWLILVGMAWFLTRLRARFWEALAAGVSFGATVFFVYIGGSISIYYCLYLFPYSVFGLIALFRLGRRMGAALKRNMAGRLPWAGPGLCAALAAGLLVFSYKASPNTYLMAYEKEDMPQYQFAEIIRQKENATLFNYGFLDGGFYYAADLIPSTRFFCTLNIQLPEMFAEQERYIRTRVTDFVVVRGEDSREQMDRQAGYRLAAEAVFWFEDSDYPYYLYEKTD